MGNRDSHTPRALCSIGRIPALLSVLARLCADSEFIALTEDTHLDVPHISSTSVQSRRQHKALKCLLQHGYAAEESRFIDPHTFGDGPRSAHSCELKRVVGTEKGKALLDTVLQSLQCLTPRGSPLMKPRWEYVRRELSFGLVVIKRFRKAAPNQERLLEAFELENWAIQVADPLPRDHGIIPSERLRETIKRLNRSILHSPIRFRTDGTGKRACWRQVGNLSAPILNDL